MPFSKEEKIVAWPIADHYALYDRVETYSKGAKAEPVPDVTDNVDIYGVMMQRLGYPSSVRLRRLLEWLFTPLEMEICHVLKDLPLENQTDNLARIFDISIDRINDILESCFQKGVLFPRDRKTRYGYRFMPRGHQQFHDGSQANISLDMKYGSRLFDFWNDWCYHEEGLNDYEGQKERFEAGTPFGRRVLPAYEAILESPDADQLQPWEDGRELINCHYRWSLAPCSCRRRVSGGGMTCRRTRSHVCLNFDIAAETVILRHGREITGEQALEVLRQAHREGLIGSMEHFQTTNFFLLCFCCDCCCHHWAPHIQQWGDYHPGWRWQKSRWEVSIDIGTCDACAEYSEEPNCIHVCQFNAIEIKEIEEGYSGYIGAPGHETTSKNKAFVDTEKCWGCLSCALVCPVKAITAHCVRPIEWVPKERQLARAKRTEGTRHRPLQTGPPE